MLIHLSGVRPTFSQKEWHCMNYLAALNAYPYFDVSHCLSVDFENPAAEALEKNRRSFDICRHFKGISMSEKILSLMDFVHNELHFVGDHASPSAMNTEEIMKVRKTGALFCSCFATVLTEMLLSLGVKAVRISCIPFLFDGDCHVGVMAFLSDINKWGYFDPTFNTYFYGQKDIVLDVFEVRKLYKNRQPVAFRHITIDKQWTLIMNGEEYASYDDWYREYMLKNLFRFIVPQKSEYGYCDRDETCYFVINPQNYKSKNEYDKIAKPDNIRYMGNVFN